MPNRGTRNTEVSAPLYVATGRRHDQFTNYLALPYGLICLLWLGLAGFLVGSFAFWFGFLNFNELAIVESLRFEWLNCCVDK